MEDEAEGVALGPGTTDDALAALAAHWTEATLSESPEFTAPLARAIFEPAVAADAPRSLSLFLKGTNFQLKVWNALLRVPSGAVTTYGRLAKVIGQPSAARAVGSAVARNPIAYLIPCHRVIRELGTFGEYRWGPVRKRAILGWEVARAS
jgi:AraC family transcriptional regulator of adaptative response/methylated-DNA-[protein]-cysteine methyltransferase